MAAAEHEIARRSLVAGAGHGGWLLMSRRMYQLLLFVVVTLGQFYGQPQSHVVDLVSLN